MDPGSSSIDPHGGRQQHDDGSKTTREEEKEDTNIRKRVLVPEETPATPSPKRLRQTKPNNKRPSSKRSQREALEVKTNEEVFDLQRKRQEILQTLRDMYEVEVQEQQQQQAGNNNNNSEYDTSFARSVTNHQVRVLLKEELNRLDEKIEEGSRLLIWRELTTSTCSRPPAATATTTPT